MTEPTRRNAVPFYTLKYRLRRLLDSASDRAEVGTTVEGWECIATILTDGGFSRRVTWASGDTMVSVTQSIHHSNST